MSLNELKLNRSGLVGFVLGVFAMVKRFPVVLATKVFGEAANPDSGTFKVPLAFALFEEGSSP